MLNAPRREPVGYENSLKYPAGGAARSHSTQFRGIGVVAAKELTLQRHNSR